MSSCIWLGPPSISNLFHRQHLKMEISCTCTNKSLQFQLFLKNQKIGFTPSDSYMATMGRRGVAVVPVMVPQKLGLLTPHHFLTLWMFSFANLEIRLQKYPLDLLPWIQSLAGGETFLPKIWFLIFKLQNSQCVVNLGIVPIHLHLQYVTSCAVLFYRRFLNVPRQIMIPCQKTI